MAVGLIDAVPIADNRQGAEFARVDGAAADPAASPTANIAWITEGYFEALGVPLLSGRTFDARDTAGSPRVVVINRRLARQVFGADDPLGRLVRIGVSLSSPFQVVGVVGDERHVGIDSEATPSFFVPYRQLSSGRGLAVIVRADSGTTAMPSALTWLLGPLAPVKADAGGRQRTISAVRSAIARIDAGLPLFQVSSMDLVVDAAVATPRSLAWLLSAFATSALMLAAIGVFGVMSHAVGQRTREIVCEWPLAPAPIG